MFHDTGGLLHGMYRIISPDETDGDEENKSSNLLSSQPRPRHQKRVEKHSEAKKSILPAFALGISAPIFVC